MHVEKKRVVSCRKKKKEEREASNRVERVRESQAIGVSGVENNGSRRADVMASAKVSVGLERRRKKILVLCL